MLPIAAQQNPRPMSERTPAGEISSQLKAELLLIHGGRGQHGGVSVNGVLADGPDRAVTKAELADGVKLKKGKKVFHKAILA